ncbi:MAG: hypothetical protein OSA84_08450 [Akkermansiaceae bacterium]|nr:hypothetical protein [Akkermansiaceae bacterium]
MKRFIIRFGLFCLPLAVLFLPVIYHLEKYRELDSVASMATGSRTNGSVIGLAYTDPMHLVKHAVIGELQPRIIALGSSRVLAFRSLYFDDEEGFYNCGRSVGKIQDFRAFLGSYPGEKPRLILLGLDQDFFGGDAGDADSSPRNYEEVGSSYGSRLVKGAKAFFETFKNDGLVTGEVMPGAESFFGRNARIDFEGYRPDGTYLYGRTFRVQDDYLFTSTMTRIEKGKGRFDSAEKINHGAVHELRRFVELCAAEGIHVVAFLPPYAARVYDRLLEQRESYPHVFTLHNELLPIFEKRGFKLFDFSDLRSVGSSDFETYDGFHASETAYLRITEIMAESDDKLGGEVNYYTIRDLLAAPYSARQLVEEIEEPFPMPPGL